MQTENDETIHPILYRWMLFGEMAVTVTMMTKTNHAFNAGVPAQRGIED